MHPEMAEAVELLTRDLLASAEVPFRFDDVSDGTADADRMPVMFWTGPAEGPFSGRGLFFQSGYTLADRLHHFLGDLQEEVMEARIAAGLWAYWPRCPEHPRTHPAVCGDTGHERPHWVCPWDDDIDLGEIGTLTLPAPPARMKRERKRRRDIGRRTSG